MSEVYPVIENSVPEPIPIDNISLALTLIEEHEMKGTTLELDMNRFLRIVEARLYCGWLSLETVEHYLNSITPYSHELEALIIQYKKDKESYCKSEGPEPHIVYANYYGVDPSDLDVNSKCVN